MVRVIKRKATRRAREPFLVRETIGFGLIANGERRCMLWDERISSPQIASTKFVSRTPAGGQLMSSARQLFLVLTILLASAVTRAIGDEKAASLPADPCRIEVLNNLVSELMDASKRGLLGKPELAFVNPRKGWCFFALAGDAALTLDTADRPLAVAKGSATVEVMRFLSAGRHTLKLTGHATKVVVRAIPALVFNGFPAPSQIAAFDTPSWRWLQKTVLTNCNTIEGSDRCAKEMAEWREQGKQWIIWSGVPGQNGEPMGDAYDYWRKNLGYSNPLMSGIQVDEFHSGFPAEVQDNALAGVARLAADPAFRGRMWIPFVAYSKKDPFATRLIRTVIEAGWPFSIERYLMEQPTEAKDRDYLLKDLVEIGRAFDEMVPGCLRKAIFTPMYSSIPNCMTNYCPCANFKIHLDMQMEILANEPVFAGLYGVQFYRSNYVDPDTLRCSARLLRHYCIEGRKDRCFHDPYELKHLLNPDFDDGTAHWKLEPAEPGSIGVGKKLAYNALQGRFPGSQPYGRAFLTLKRSPTTPNVFSQEITHLEPGRLYSLKMITADHQDLQHGTSQRALHAISIRLEGVEPLTGPQEAFSCPFHSGEKEAGFTEAKPLWMNYHWRVFWAKSPTARLMVTDWKDGSEPGGPAGQELIFNFLELQPYLAEAK